MTRLGIIRCQARSEICAGFTCFPALHEKSGSFAEYEDELILVGFDSCGGCARHEAKKVVERAARLRDCGAEVIHLGKCIAKTCPWRDLFYESIAQQTGLPVVRGTHK